MNFAYIIFCVNALFCGVSHSDAVYFEFYILNYKGEEIENNVFSFEEGLSYTLVCTRYYYHDLHWEVESYGLKWTIFNGSDYNRINSGNTYNSIFMDLKLHRDDDNITIGCYSKYKYDDNRQGCKKITFYWDKKKPHKPSSLPDATSGAEQKCYQKNNIEKCAFMRETWHDKYKYYLVELQIRTRKIVKNGWVPVVAGVAGVAVLLVLGFICYWFIRKRKQNQPTHAEPPIVYSEIRLESDSQRGRGTQERESNAEPAIVYADLQWASDHGQQSRTKRGRGNFQFANILRFKSKKNVPKKNEPKLKNAPKNTRSETEDTGTVERINDLYSTAEDTRIATVERFNDLYSTADDTRIGTVERFNDLYSTAEDTRIGTVERINDLYLTAADTQKNTLHINTYSTIWG